MLARARSTDTKLRSGHCRQGDQGADFHVVGPDGERRTLQAADTANHQGIAPDALDVGAHGIETVTHVLHVGLAGGVTQDCRAFGEHGGQHCLFRAGDAHFVQKNVGAAQPLGLQDEAVGGDLDIGTQGLQGEQVGIKTPPPDAVAARPSDGNETAPCQQRSGEQGCRANLAA